MIDRKMTREQLIAELWARVLRRVDILAVTQAELDQAISAAAAEIELEISTYWAGLELKARRMSGERVQ